MEKCTYHKCTELLNFHKLNTACDQQPDQETRLPAPQKPWHHLHWLTPLLQHQPWSLIPFPPHAWLFLLQQSAWLAPPFHSNLFEDEISAESLLTVLNQSLPIPALIYFTAITFCFCLSLQQVRTQGYKNILLAYCRSSGNWRHEWIQISEILRWGKCKS